MKFVRIYVSESYYTFEMNNLVRSPKYRLESNSFLSFFIAAVVLLIGFGVSELQSGTGYGSCAVGASYTFSLQNTGGYSFGFGGGSCSFSWSRPEASSPTCASTISTDAPWLTVQNPKITGTTGSATIAVAPNAGATARAGNVTITYVPDGSTTVQAITESAAAASTLQISPSSASFSYQLGATSSTLNQSLAVSSTGSVLNYNVSVAGGNWLTATPSSGSTPGTLRISAAAAGMAAGSYSGTITLTSSGGSSVTVPVKLAVSSTLQITTPQVLPQGEVAAAYSQSLAASGGTPPYTAWAASSGTIPPGLALSPAGVLSGTPTTAGAYKFTGKVTDTAGASASASLQLTINPPALTVATTSPLPAGQMNALYSQTLKASGGTPPYSNWTDTGTLPTGLTLSAAGVFSGTPTTWGTFNFIVKVKDSAAVTASASLQLIVKPPALTITSGSSTLPNGQVNAPYSVLLAASGGTPPYSSWTLINGTSPAGLTFSPAGLWSGTPTTAGTYYFTVQVTDSAGASAAASLQLLINPAKLAIATSSPLPPGTLNAPYSASLAATGGTPPYSKWTTTSGSIPPGLAVNPTGVLSGEPKTASTFSFTVQVVDSAGASAAASLRLTVNAATLGIATAAVLPGGQVNTEYSLSFVATGGTPPYADWAITKGTVPPGLTLIPAGVLSGTSPTAGTYSFTIKVTDSAGASASNSFQLTIGAPMPSITAVVSSTSLVAGSPVTIDSWAAVFGTNLAPSGDSRMWNVSTEIVNGNLPLNLDGVSVTVNGKPAAIQFISPGQLNIQLPDDTAIGPVPVLVTTTAGGTSAPFIATYAKFAPGFFPATAPFIVAQHADGTYVTTTSPALPGEAIILWGAGMGPANPAVPAGEMFSGANPLVNAVTVTIGGQPADVAFAGVVGPGLVQINVYIPSGTGMGDQEIIANVGGVRSPSGAYISVGAPSASPNLREGSTGAVAAVR